MNFNGYEYKKSSRQQMFVGDDGDASRFEDYAFEHGYAESS